MFTMQARVNRDVETGRFVSPKNLPWPKPRGFSSEPSATDLNIGKVIDRFGKLTGQYGGEPGTSISDRGMAPGSENMTYAKFRVIKPITVPAGRAAPVPEFGARGGAMQYFFEGGFERWWKNGFLEKIK